MPKIVDHDERRKLLVDQSSRIIAKQGIDELSIRTLAASLGISTGMITHYFDSKEQILFAALEQVHARVFKKIEQAIGDAKGLEAIRLRLQASVPVTAAERDDASIMMQFWSKATHTREFSRFLGSEYEKIRALDMEHLEYAQKHGQIARDVDLEHVFKQLDSMQTGLSVTCVFNKSQFTKSTVYAIIDQTLAQLSLK